jgi:hypothetical protein
MSENHSRANKRAEQTLITDEPHDNYRLHDPWTGIKLEHGMPILLSTPSGNVLKKEIENNILHCPECNSVIHYDSDSDPVCPACGIICNSKDGVLDERIVIDAKAAGRYDGNS